MILPCIYQHIKITIAADIHHFYKEIPVWGGGELLSTHARSEGTPYPRAVSGSREGRAGLCLLTKKNPPFYIVECQWSSAPSLEQEKNII